MSDVHDQELADVLEATRYRRKKKPEPVDTAGVVAADRERRVTRSRIALKQGPALRQLASAVDVDQVRRDHPDIWLRIRGNCIEAAWGFDLDAHAAAIVLTVVKAKASGVLA